MKLDILNKITKVGHRAAFGLKKHSPEIMVVGGVVGTVTAAVLACKATTKASEIKEKLENDLEVIEEISSRDDVTNYTEEDKKKDTIIAYKGAVLGYIKLYAPSVILGVLSISTILTGHNVTRKRNVALAAAYTAIDKSFKSYRERVADRFGSEVEKEIRYNITQTEVEETVVNEKGKEKTVKSKANEINLPKYSDYAKFFDASCNGWSKDPELNLYFLKKQEEYATDRLRRFGHLFLNEVYDMLGIERTAAGQMVGWIYNEKDPVGDNFVDFGIYNLSNDANRRFVNGTEPVIILDFNVDGVILDKI